MTTTAALAPSHTFTAGHTGHGFKFPAGAPVREHGPEWVKVLCPNVPLGEGEGRGESWEPIPRHHRSLLQVV